MPVPAVLLSNSSKSEPDQGQIIDTALNAVREHLGMSVAYLSEFVDGRSVFRNVSAPGLEELIDVGDSQSLDDVYCKHILEGRLPELIPDTAKEPICRALPITEAIPIGSHMSIPILLPDGEAFGMFCCLSPEPNPSLNSRDLETMRMFAELAAKQVRTDHQQNRENVEKTTRIERVIETSGFAVVYQPIVDLLKMKVAGFEALSRFSEAPIRTPDVWFNEAEDVGLSTPLETAAIAKALTGLNMISSDAYLSVNASPQTLLTDEFIDTMRRHDLRRVVLEITEHAVIEDYDLVGAVSLMRTSLQHPISCSRLRQREVHATQSKRRVEDL